FQPFVIHQKTDRRAVRATTKTMIKLLGRTDIKRRGFFIMERATGTVLPAFFLQRHARVNHLDDIGARQQLVNEMLRNAAHANRLLYPNPGVPRETAKRPLNVIGLFTLRFPPAREWRSWQDAV